MLKKLLVRCLSSSKRAEKATSSTTTCTTLKCKHRPSTPYHRCAHEGVCNDNNDPVYGHLYLIKEREFLKTNENVFKIGKTRNIRNRMPAYPKNSLLYVSFHHPDIDSCEKVLIRDFTERYKLRTDIGAEYFEHAPAPNESMHDVVDAFLNVVVTSRDK